MNDATRSPEGAVQAAVLTYIQSVEEGETPDLGTLTGHLQPEERTEVHEILDAIGWARAQFPSPLAPTRSVGDRYELRNELGAGGFGKVWRAFDRRLEKEVAIKFVDLLTKSSLEVKDLFEAERRALARVDRSGIARILDRGQDEDRLYLVMDLVPGRPLSAVLEQLEQERETSGAAPSPAALRRAIGLDCASGLDDLTAESSWSRTAARIVTEVLRNLEAVHAAGIVHRDIKPSNVMLQGGGYPVLLDFGMAALLDERRGKVTESLVGTLPYLAPEQLRQHRTGNDPRTDVYQVGLLLYELLTLVPAFDPRATVGLVELVREGAFERPRRRDPSVPRELEDVCLCALETNPDRRYASASAFREDLGRWLSGVAAPLASRGGRARSTLRNTRYFVRRHRAASAAAASLLVGGLIVAMTLGGEPGVALVECSISTNAADRLDAEVESTGEQEMYAILVSKISGSDEQFYLPLRPGDTDTFGGRVAAGRTRVALHTPDGRAVRAPDFEPVRVQLFSTAKAELSDALRHAFEQLWLAARENAHDQGISREGALRVLAALDLPGRSGEAGPASPVEPARLLDGGSWDDRGIAASGLPLK